jgi:hypothetical protein
MKLSCVLFPSILLTVGAVAVCAQVVPSATSRQFSITAGGIASLFQPDFADAQTCTPPVSGTTYCYPAAGTGSGDQPLIGAGAYVDIRLRRWVQFEAEGRWLRYNAYEGIKQDNYLIGPRLPVYRFWKATVYAKALGGYAQMKFGPVFNNQSGKFTDLAFGGGVDLKLTKRLSLRLPDVEYQYWPSWSKATLSPYGASIGVGYRIF